MEFSKRNKLSSHERMFYIALFYCANNIAMQNENQDWPSDYFPVSNSELNGLSGFDKRAISNLRNSLKQRGLIDFLKGNGKKADPKYRIFYLTTIGYEIVPDRGPNGGENAPDKANGGKIALDTPPIRCKNVPDTVPDSVPDTVPDSVTIGYENAPDPYDSSYPNFNKKNKNINININNPIESYPIPERCDGMGKDESFRTFRRMVEKNIGFQDLVNAHPEKARLIDEITEIIVEVAFYKKDSLTVSGYEYPIGVIRDKLLSLEEDHIEYVLECFEKNTTEIRNIRQYLIRTLINSAETMDAYYTAMVQRDMNTPYYAAKEEVC